MVFLGFDLCHPSAWFGEHLVLQTYQRNTDLHTVCFCGWPKRFQRSLTLPDMPSVSKYAAAFGHLTMGC